ncbi:MAG: c-type cytochrome [Gammaproteobacteria bacterium]
MKGISAVIGAVAIFAVMIILISIAIGDREPVAEDSAALERLAPVGKVTVASASAGQDAAANAAGAAGEQPSRDHPGDSGKAVYDGACAACHGAGLAGAPKVGDPTAWQARIAQGEAVLLKHAIDGFQGSGGVMPPKGGRDDLSDEEVTSAMRYMVAQGQ